VLTRCEKSESNAVLVGHGGVWGVIQQSLKIEPIRAENGTIISCIRRSSGWEAKQL
jgi:hypothetical protein